MSNLGSEARRVSHVTDRRGPPGPGSTSRSLPGQTPDRDRGRLGSFERGERRPSPGPGRHGRRPGGRGRNRGSPGSRGGRRVSGRRGGSTNRPRLARMHRKNLGPATGHIEDRPRSRAGVDPVDEVGDHRSGGHFFLRSGARSSWIRLKKSSSVAATRGAAAGKSLGIGSSKSA